MLSFLNKRIRYPQYVLKNVNIPDNSKQYLSSSGLPTGLKVIGGDDFVPCKPGFPLKEPSAGPLRLLDPWHNNDFFVLGYIRYKPFYDHINYFTICASGKVYLVTYGERDTQFVNSSVKQFVNCLEEYNRFWSMVNKRANDDIYANRLYGSLKVRLHAIEPDILRSENNFWSDTIDDIETMI